MSNDTVSYELSGDVGIIRIANPPVNALSHAVRSGIADALSQAAADASQAVLLLCSGRTFIAGADITEFGKPMREPSLPEVITLLESHPQPVVAALHGTALGGGLEVAMAAHYRCAVPSAKLGLPEVKLGLLPGAGGTQRLPRLIGVKKSLDMITGGAPIGAGQALADGLVDEVIEGELEAGALAYTRSLLASNAGPRPTGQREVADAPPSSFYDDYRAGIARRTRGLIAPGFIIELVELACSTDVETGQARERERFLECRESPQSSALRHVFFAERATGKLPDIPADTPVRDVSKVAVIGAGTMGGGIAMCFANAGIPVTIVEMQQENLDRGLGVVRRNYETSVKRGRFTQEQADGFLANLNGTLDYADIADADVVIEAVFESMEVKKIVFAQLDATCKPGAILATNTSYLDVDEIAAVTNRPQDVVGAHFFSPANVMKLLEVVRAGKTAPDVVQTFMKLARKIGKIPVAVGVCHGFVGNRMLKGYGRQAQLLLLEGATPQQIDSAMEKWGLAMGPLAVSDLAGLDIGYRSRRDQGIESRAVREFALADTLVEMERLGQKSGAGYYRYDPETRKRENDDTVLELVESVAAEFGVSRREIGEQEILDRLLLALVNEGANILEEGIAARPSDIDIVYLNGYGFPAWRGGPMFYADTLGLSEVVARMEALRSATGDDCWEPAALLQKLLAEGSTLGSLN
ncbi:MAG: 3-hydroxyacyl-CoA dehydrogenase NAD-binding domain-containing protein [Halieaceae bacterium]